MATKLAITDRRWLPAFAVLAVLDCDAREPEPAPEPARSRPLASHHPALNGHPWMRLVIPEHPVVPASALELSHDDVVALGAKSHRAFASKDPIVWFFAFEFADQAQLFAKQDAVLAAWPADAPPFVRKPTHTGAWLLVTGFPTAAAFAPTTDAQREAVRGTFADRWAGEE
jgi:hypothetical protein